MSNVAIFTDGRPAEYRRSVHTPDFEGRQDVLINPDVADLISRGVPPREWKRVGDAVVEKTDAEKAEANEAILVARRASVTIDEHTDALIEVIAPTLNPPTTAEALRSDVIDELKSRI